MDYKLISYLKDIIIKSGEIAIKMRNDGLEIQKKNDKSPVTNADFAVSDYIYKQISNLNLNFPIICEEQSLRTIDNNKLFWLIDPIDGTKSFIRGEDTFTVNIALISDKKPTLGFIFQPITKKLYYTDHKNNLIIEENGIKLSPNYQHKDKLTAIVSSNHFNTRTKQYLAQYNIQELIAIPSSIKLCLIADGTGDIFPKFGETMEWDIAAGHALINATGGNITDLRGNEMTYNKEGFVNADFLAFSQHWNIARVL